MELSVGRHDDQKSGQRNEREHNADGESNPGDYSRHRKQPAHRHFATPIVARRHGDIGKADLPLILCEFQRSGVT